MSYQFDRWQIFYTSAYNDGKGPDAITGRQRFNHDLGLAYSPSTSSSWRIKQNYDKRADVVTWNTGLGYWYNFSKRTRFYVTGTRQKTEGLNSFIAADFGLHHDF